MKTAGIIAEYNPFHNGHQYQMEELRARTGADYIVIAMSGDFVQRGEPAIYDKYTRTRMALTAGADLVLELPAAFATSSAEDFAACGVALLDQIGVVDSLCFGSECGDTAPLEDIAQLLLEEPSEYSKMLKEHLRGGDTFPKARASAIQEWMQQNNPDIYCPTDGEDFVTSLLSSPNNILGIEYIKALLRRQSRIQPITILRSGHGYHETQIDPDRNFASATAIRQAVREEATEQAMKHMPVLPPGKLTPVFPDDLSAILNYRLLELANAGQDFSSFSDVSTELAERMQNQLLQFSSYTERIMQMKTKQYTYTRISRAFLHMILGITDSHIKTSRSCGYCPYARILGFRKRTAPLLAQMKEKSSIPLITKTAAAPAILSPDALAMFRQDLHCSHIYQSVLQQKDGVLPRNEYTHSVIIL